MSACRTQLYRQGCRPPHLFYPCFASCPFFIGLYALFIQDLCYPIPNPSCSSAAAVMSFGYGVGDVIAVSTLARTIWGRFRDASDQFHAIQQEYILEVLASFIAVLISFSVFGLHRLLDDVANNLSGLQITDEQRDSLSKLVEGCRIVLDDTEKLIRKNEILDTKSSGISSRKVLKKLKWDSTTVNELRNRVISSTAILNGFNTSLVRSVSFGITLILSDRWESVNTNLCSSAHFHLVNCLEQRTRRSKE